MENFFVPNSSVVVDTAREVIAPLHTPMTAVLMLRERLVLLTSKKKAPAVGAINATIAAGLEILYLALDNSNQTQNYNYVHVQRGSISLILSNVIKNTLLT